MLFAGQAFATVGGPTYVSALAYDAQQKAIYYTEHDFGGRGCRPIVHTVDLATLKDSEVKSCTQVEQQYPYNDDSAYSQFLSNTYDGLPYLGSVSLKNNRIDIRVEHLSEHVEADMVFWNEFRATISQDGKQLAQLEHRGCSEDQPHVFEGYAIPDSDAMAILISNKKDCFEGGYIGESLQVIKGITYYDTNIVRSYKQEAPTEPNLANAVVYAAANNEQTADIAPAPQKDSAKNIVFLVGALVAGIGLGYLIGRQFFRPANNTPGSSQ